MAFSSFLIALFILAPSIVSSTCFDQGTMSSFAGSMSSFANNVLPYGWTTSGNANSCDGTWEGITCDASLTYVTVVNLNAFCARLYSTNPNTVRQIGSINAWTSLMHITEIHLSQCNLAGSLPFLTFTALKVIDFSVGVLSGTIPETYSSLTSLISINLSFNSLSGTLPNTWTNSPLQIINFSNNNFAGAMLPSSWVAYNPTLMSLQIANSGLVNSIPSTYCFPLMTTLSLNSNPALNGVLPSCFNNVQMPNAVVNFANTGITNAWTFNCLRIPTNLSNYGGYFYSKSCLGSGSTITQNSTYSVCSFNSSLVTPPAYYYLPSPCIVGTYLAAGADGKAIPCSTPNVGTNYAISPCIAGSVTSPGSNTVLSNCNVVSSGSYISSLCTASANSVVKQCSPFVISTGQYVSQLCFIGSASTLGHDFTISNCSSPTSGFSFVKIPCNAGSLTIIGSNTVIQNCQLAPSNYYVSTLCNPGTYLSNATSLDSIVLPCSTLTAGTHQYYSRLCYSGVAGVLGYNSIISNCTLSSNNGMFISTLCVSGGPTTLGSDTNFTLCTLPTPGYYVSQLCVIGSTNRNILGSNTVLKSCSTPFASGVCTSGTTLSKYVSALCVEGDAFENLGSDTVIENCLVPGPNQVVLYQCNPGNYNSIGSNVQLSANSCPPTKIPTASSGFTNSSAFSCVCASGYYTNTNDGSCVLCYNGVGPLLSGLICNSLNLTIDTVGVLPGFYKVTDIVNQQVVAIPCRSSNVNCVNPNQTDLNVCEIGYKGFMCDTCSDGYYNSEVASKGPNCMKCINTPSTISLQLFLLFLSACFFILLVGFLVWMKLQRAKQIHLLEIDEKRKISSKNLKVFVDTEGAYSAALQRTLLSHLQVLGVIGRFNFLWPPIIVNLFAFSNSVSSVNISSLFGSIKCLSYINRLTIPVNDLLFELYSLVFGYILILIFWVCVALRYRSGENLWRKMKDRSVGGVNVLQSVIISLIKLNYLMYSSINRAVFQLFSCVSYPLSDSRLFDALDLVCYSMPHVEYILVLALPVILIIIIGQPLVVFMNIKRHKLLIKQKDDEKRERKLIATWSFIFEGYREERWWWEFITQLRKVSLNVVLVFMTTSASSDTYVQGLIAVFILSVALAVQLYVRPYETFPENEGGDEMNMIEIAGLSVSVITLYFGLWTYAKAASAISQFVVTFSVLLLNVTWLVYIFYNLLKRNKYFIRFVNAVFFCCKRKETSWGGDRLKSFYQSDEKERNNKEMEMGVKESVIFVKNPL